MWFDLHTDWKRIVLKADCMKWIAAAVLCSGLELYFQIYGPPAHVPLGLFAGLSAINSVCAALFRVRAQKEFQNG